MLRRFSIPSSGVQGVTKAEMRRAGIRPFLNNRREGSDGVLMMPLRRENLAEHEDRLRMAGSPLQQLSALAFRSIELASDAKLSGACELSRKCRADTFGGHPVTDISDRRLSSGVFPLAKTCYLDRAVR